MREDPDGLSFRVWRLLHCAVDLDADAGASRGKAFGDAVRPSDVRLALRDLWSARAPGLLFGTETEPGNVRQGSAGSP